jgi:hypothetical protein
MLTAQQICLRRMNTDDQVCEVTTKGTTIFVFENVDIEDCNIHCF